MITTATRFIMRRLFQLKKVCFCKGNWKAKKYQEAKPDTTFAVMEIEEEETMTVSNNPSSNGRFEFTFSNDLSSEESISIYIVNLNGTRFDLGTMNGRENYTIDIRDLPKGTYILHTITHDKVYSERIIYF